MFVPFTNGENSVDRSQTKIGGAVEKLQPLIVMTARDFVHKVPRFLVRDHPRHGLIADRPETGQKLRFQIMLK